MQSFCEALFNFSSDRNKPDYWRDVSTNDYHIYESSFGVVRIRRRLHYPATFAVVQGDCLYVGYGDFSTGREIIELLVEDVSEQSFYAENMLIKADCIRQDVTVQRDSLSTMPLFAYTGSNMLVLSNCFDVVAQFLEASDKKVDSMLVIDVLTGGLGYGHSYMPSIYPLLDRSRLVWSMGKSSVLHPLDAQVRSDAVAHESNAHAYPEYLEYTLDKYLSLCDGTIAAELSGGTDSSVITRYAYSYAKTHGRDLLASSLMFPGEHGLTQAAKLDDLGVPTKRFVIDLVNDYPLSWVNSSYYRPFHHSTDLYTASVGRMAEYFAANGANHVLGGIGGDELNDNIPALDTRRPYDISKNVLGTAKPYPEWIHAKRFQEFASNALAQHNDSHLKKPWPTISRHVVETPLSGNNTYLEHNIWPVLPLADPVLYQYCQGLPVRYRNRKRLMRAYMQAAGFPPSVYSGVREDFSGVFAAFARHNLGYMLEKTMQNSVLARAGLVDGHRVLDMWNTRNHATDKKEQRLMFPMYELLVLEINLQGLGLQIES